MRFLKIIGVTCSILLFFSVLFTIATALFPLSSAIHDVFTREKFVKMVVKIETQEGHTGRAQGVSSYCIINSKKLVVRDAYEDEVEIDNYYHVWYNTKTDKVYLTDRKSQSFDALGRLWHSIMVELSSLFVSISLFFGIRFIARRIMRAKNK